VVEVRGVLPGDGVENVASRAHNCWYPYRFGHESLPLGKGAARVEHHALEHALVLSHHPRQKMHVTELLHTTAVLLAKGQFARR
jgi:hypothetical protein